MSASTVDGDLRVTGTIRPGSITYPAGGIANAAIAPAAAIDANKLEHRHAFTHRQATGADVASKTEELYTALAAGVLNSVKVQVSTKATGTSIGTDKKFTVDIQKGNASTGFATVLTGVITIDQTIANRTTVSGTMSGTVNYAADDTFRVVVTASGSTGSQAQGLVVTIVVDEASP